MASKKLNLVVATCKNRGIGNNGGLPWRIKGDMAFFKRITSTSNEEGKQNAAIMGRKTWDSIPKKFRPLAGRINVVISRTLTVVADGVYVAGSLEEAIDMLTAPPLADQVAELFVIGGSSIYELALSSPRPVRLYLTQVLADYECDTFMPKYDESLYKKITVAGVDESVQSENGIEYMFEVYDKIEHPMACPKYFNIMVAMMENRGIGYKGNLAWPPITKDYEYYLEKTTIPRKQGKRCVIIKGRASWVDTGLHERSLPNIINIVISSTLKECPEYVSYIANGLDDALKFATSPPLGDIVEQIWVMGGTSIYEMAVKSSLCHRLYLTRVHSNHISDRWFPDFESSFKQIRDPEVPEETYEENGVKFNFEVYEKK